MSRTSIPARTSWVECKQHTRVQMVSGFVPSLSLISWNHPRISQVLVKQLRVSGSQSQYKVRHELGRSTAAFKTAAVKRARCFVMSATAEPFTLFGIDVEINAKEIEEAAAQDILRRIKTTKVQLSNGTMVSTAYVDWSKDEAAWKDPPLVLIPGFDSSVLEYRRLAPLLVEAGFRVVILDIIGLGFTERPSGADYGPTGKRDHLACFVKQVLDDREIILLGASLGGATAIDFSLACPDKASKLILIDAQGFIDGNGGQFLIPPFDRVGVAILKTTSLRNMANKMAYFNKERFATMDAMRIGRLHCFCKNWDQASIAFIKSGGYSLSKSVSSIRSPVLILWGEDDEILDNSYVEKFESALRENLQENLRIHVIPECGHVCHLEHSQLTCKYIETFLK